MLRHSLTNSFHRHTHDGSVTVRASQPRSHPHDREPRPKACPSLTQEGPGWSPECNCSNCLQTHTSATQHGRNPTSEFSSGQVRVCECAPTVTKQQQEESPLSWAQDTQQQLQNWTLTTPHLPRLTSHRPSMAGQLQQH